MPSQIVYGVRIYLGRKENDAIALAWAHEFCQDGAVLDRNFALIGPGDSDRGEVSEAEAAAEAIKQ